MTPTVKTQKITVLKSGAIKGHFILSDRSKTQFEIEKNGNWYQWGNSTENRCITVGYVERLVEKNIFTNN